MSHGCSTSERVIGASTRTIPSSSTRDFSCIFPKMLATSCASNRCPTQEFTFSTSTRNSVSSKQGVCRSWPLASTTWLWIALFAVGWLLLATLGAQYGVTHLEASRAAVLVVFELIAAVLSVAWFNDEVIAPRTWLGAGMVTLAAVMAGWPERSPAQLTRSTS